MKKIVFLMLIYSTSATAYYPTYVSKTNHLVEISQKNSGQWNSLVILNDEAIGKPIHDETKKILTSINSKLFIATDSGAKKLINNIPTLRYKELKHITFNGPIETKITTQDDGIVTAEVKGFTLSTEVKFDMLGFSLYGKVKTSELNFSADYNVISGQVYNIRDNGNMRINVDIDGNGILNNLVAEAGEYLLDVFKPNFFQKNLESSINSIINNNYYIAGIESVVPDNTWVINGIDLGVEIKNIIKGTSPGKYLSLAISENNHKYYTGWLYRTYYMNKVEFDISGNYKVVYGNEPVYATGSWINPCAGPGGASHGCYEP
ncbi:hypothetical protein [Shewanella vaxholmensis]|uniref:hypothetical protein n=1 Tax=Shewanella vaxholmensis TaxID=3063535 RepID=UPI00319821CB